MINEPFTSRLTSSKSDIQEAYNILKNDFVLEQVTYARIGCFVFKQGMNPEQCLSIVSKIMSVNGSFEENAHLDEVILHLPDAKQMPLALSTPEDCLLSRAERMTFDAVDVLMLICGIYQTQPVWFLGMMRGKFVYRFFETIRQEKSIDFKDVNSQILLHGRGTFPSDDDQLTIFKDFPYINGKILIFTEL
jgi:hypothetical protein